MSDKDVQQLVYDELVFDPKVDNRAVAVTVENGVATLRGTVGTFREKREAGNAAGRVKGVDSVENKLEVRILTKHGRDDADLRGDVLRALELDSIIPQTIGVTVVGGWVTLNGTAGYQFQKDEAGFIAGNVAGVVDVDNYIELNTPQADSGQIRDSIEKAFDRDARIESNGLTVTTTDGEVEVDGTVRSKAEHDAAIAAVWKASGVTSVADKIRVAS